MVHGTRSESGCIGPLCSCIIAPNLVHLCPCLLGLLHLVFFDSHLPRSLLDCVIIANEHTLYSQIHLLHI